MLSKLWNSSRPREDRPAFDCDLLKRFREDTHGGVLVYMGIMLPVLLGVSGLAVDGSLWYAQKRSVQAIADTAAYSVMLEIERIGDADLAKIAAKEDAVVYGLDESAGDSITINIPPKFGAYKGIDGYYEVIIGQPASIFLAGLLVGDFDTAAAPLAAIRPAFWRPTRACRLPSRSTTAL